MSNSEIILDADDELSASEIKQLSPLRKALDECRGAFYFMGIITFFITVLSVAPILYIMNVFDRVIPTRSTITLVSLLTLVIGMYFFWSALEWLRSRVMVRISMRIDWDMAGEVFNACFKKALMHRDPNVHQVMGDLLTLRQFMGGRPILALMDAPFAVVFLVFGFLIHPLLALFIIVATVILLVITLFTRKVQGAAIRAAGKHNAEANRVAASGLRNAETAFAMGMLPALRNRWYTKHRTFLQYHVNASEASGFIGLIGGVFTKALPTLQITAGVMLAGAGLISAGGVIAAGFIISKAVGPFRELIERWEDIVRARMAYERLDELLLDQQQDEAKMSLPEPQGQVLLDDVHVKIGASNREIIKGVHFELPAGRVMAVVGPNAAGKSSLLKLIMGVWRPTDGAVRLDGAEVSDWNHDELGPHLGYVAQVPDLFEATVAENIARLGEMDAAKVVEAAQLAGIHEMILSFPQGYDTILCAGEFQLSGGQAQRIAIARAFYNKPQLVVLDEPNASLDDTAEQALLNAIEQLRSHGSTVIMTSHRPRLVGIADYLLILKDGQQVDFGPTADVLNRQQGTKKLEAVKPALETQPAKALPSIVEALKVESTEQNKAADSAIKTDSPPNVESKNIEPEPGPSASSVAPEMEQHIEPKVATPVQPEPTLPNSEQTQPVQAQPVPHEPKTVEPKVAESTGSDSKAVEPNQTPIVKPVAMPAVKPMIIKR